MKKEKESSDAPEFESDLIALNNPIAELTSNVDFGAEIARSKHISNSIEDLTRGPAAFIASQKLDMGMSIVIDAFSKGQLMFQSPIQSIFEQNKMMDAFRFESPLSAITNATKAMTASDLAIANRIPNLVEFFSPRWVDEIHAINRSNARLYAGLDISSFGNRFGISKIPSKNLIQVFEILERSYIDFGLQWDEKDDKEEHQVVVESEFTTKNVVRLIQADDQKLEEDASKIKEFAHVTNSQLYERLDVYNSRLLNPYMGAIKAHSTGGPDALRHYSASARTLLDQLISDLAPKNEVEKWAFEEGKIKDKSQVNRIIKLQFVFRFIHDQELQDVFEADIIAHNKLIQNLSQLTHKLDRELIQVEREVLHSKVEYLALLLLNIYYSR